MQTGIVCRLSDMFSPSAYISAVEKSVYRIRVHRPRTCIIPASPLGLRIGSSTWWLQPNATYSPIVDPLHSQIQLILNLKISENVFAYIEHIQMFLLSGCLQ